MVREISTMKNKALRRMGCGSTRYVRAFWQHRSHWSRETLVKIKRLWEEAGTSKSRILEARI